MINYLKNPLFLTWMLTNKCNLRCKFCYLEDYQGKELELDEINQVLDIIQDKEFTHVSLLGGEPTECEYFEPVSYTHLITGILLALSAVATFVAGILAGFFADRNGRKPVMVLGQ